MKYQMEGRRLVYYMPKELDDCVVTELRREVDTLIELYQIREMVLDFADTQFMDSSGVGFVIGRWKKMKLYGGLVRVKNQTERMKRLFRVSGLDKLVEEVHRNGCD